MELSFFILLHASARLCPTAWAEDDGDACVEHTLWCPAAPLSPRIVSIDECEAAAMKINPFIDIFWRWLCPLLLNYYFDFFSSVFLLLLLLLLCFGYDMTSALCLMMVLLQQGTVAKKLIRFIRDVENRTGQWPGIEQDEGESINPWNMGSSRDPCGIVRAV